MYKVALLALLMTFRGGNVLPRAEGIYPISTDCTKLFPKRLAAAKFRYVDPGVTVERFGNACVIGTHDLVVVQFDAGLVSTQKVLAEIEKRGYRPATSDELVTFSTRYRSFPTFGPVIAFGTVWKGPDSIPRVLIAEPALSGMKLDITRMEGEWTSNVRFLAAFKRN